jgi:hypothetical protein
VQKSSPEYARRPEHQQAGFVPASYAPTPLSPPAPVSRFERHLAAEMSLALGLGGPKIGQPAAPSEPKAATGTANNLTSVLSGANKAMTQQKALLAEALQGDVQQQALEPGAATTSAAMFLRQSPPKHHTDAVAAFSGLNSSAVFGSAPNGSYLVDLAGNNGKVPRAGQGAPAPAVASARNGSNGSNGSNGFASLSTAVQNAMSVSSPYALGSTSLAASGSPNRHTMATSARMATGAARREQDIMRATAALLGTLPPAAPPPMPFMPGPEYPTGDPFLSGTTRSNDAEDALPPPPPPPPRSGLPRSAAPAIVQDTYAPAPSAASAAAAAATSQIVELSSRYSRTITAAQSSALRSAAASTAGMIVDASGVARSNRAGTVRMQDGQLVPAGGSQGGGSMSLGRAHSLAMEGREQSAYYSALEAMNLEAARMAAIESMASGDYVNPADPLGDAVPVYDEAGNLLYYTSAAGAASAVANAGAQDDMLQLEDGTLVLRQSSMPPEVHPATTKVTSAMDENGELVLTTVVPVTSLRTPSGVIALRQDQVAMLPEPNADAVRSALSEDQLQEFTDMDMLDQSYDDGLLNEAVQVGSPRDPMDMTYDEVDEHDLLEEQPVFYDPQSGLTYVEGEDGQAYVVDPEQFYGENELSAVEGVDDYYDPNYAEIYAPGGPFEAGQAPYFDPSSQMYYDPVTGESFSVPLLDGGETDICGPEPGDPSGVILKGSLVKCGSTNRFWRKRYCVLTDSELIYYTSKKAADEELQSGYRKLTRRGNVQLFTADGRTAMLILGPGTMKKAPTAFAFRIATDNRVFTFCASTSESRMIFVGSVASVIGIDVNDVLALDDNALRYQ